MKFRLYSAYSHSNNNKQHLIGDFYGNDVCVLVCLMTELGSKLEVSEEYFFESGC